MRCPECNKFASLDDQTDPEAEDGDIAANGDGTLTYMAQVRRALTCAECGTELKECTFEFSETVDEHNMLGKGGAAVFTGECTGEEAENHKHAWYVLSVDPTGTSEELPRVGAKGRPLKGTVTLLGVELEVTCECEHCDARIRFRVEHSGESAAQFEEIV